DRPNWVNAVQQAIAEWNSYLPLVQVDRAEIADIAIWCRTPPLQLTGGRLGRVRSAETRFEIEIDRAGSEAVLSHRFQIWLRPDQTAIYLQAAARHELGHALGIWGHSLAATDAMYFSQVRNPPLISARDINTLKRIYQQPTRLGWTLTDAIDPATR
ncbi:MAG: peptidase, partial [Microcoleus sp. SIO2G3]|nr:peptidase [Microcoleus sp. SIO2G3]